MHFIRQDRVGGSNNRQPDSFNSGKYNERRNKRISQSHAHLPPQHANSQYMKVGRDPNGTQNIQYRQIARNGTAASDLHKVLLVGSPQSVEGTEQAQEHPRIRRISNQSGSSKVHVPLPPLTQSSQYAYQYSSNVNESERTQSLTTQPRNQPELNKNYHRKASNDSQPYNTATKNIEILDSRKITNHQLDTSQSSFIDAPPIPERYRYRADLVRKQSASTEGMNNSNQRGKQQSNLSNQVNREYFVMSSNSKNPENAQNQLFLVGRNQNTKYQRQIVEEARRMGLNNAQTEQYMQSKMRPDDVSEKSHHTILRRDAHNFQHMARSETPPHMRRLQTGNTEINDTNQALNQHSRMTVNLHTITNQKQYAESIDSKLGYADGRTTAAGDQLSPPRDNNRYLQSLAQSRESQQNGESRYHSIDRQMNGSVAKSQEIVSSPGALSNERSDSMDNPVMILTIQTLARCYNIGLELSQKIVSDCRTQITHYRKQIKSAQGGNAQRVVLSPAESSFFFDTLTDEVNSKIDSIIEKQADLRPILSIILLGMQQYQDYQVKQAALKCLSFLSRMHGSILKPKIWHWIQYTSVKMSKSKFLEESRNQLETSLHPKDSVKVNVHGFIYTIHQLIDDGEHLELAKMACTTLMTVAQENLLELFLTQLSSLFTNRVSYLMMIQENFQMFIDTMKQIIDDYDGSTLLDKFYVLGIPNFFVAQCLCLAEGNLIYLKETQLEEFMPDMAQQSPGLLKDEEVQKRISRQNLIAQCLLTDIWSVFPDLFTNLQHTQLLQNEVDEEDFGLREHLGEVTPQTNETKKKLLGTKILQVFKRIAVKTTLDSEKIAIASRICFLLEDQCLRKDQFGPAIYRLMIFLLIAWHERQLVREHILQQFVDIFKLDKNLPLQKLIEPLCHVIAKRLTTEFGGEGIYNIDSPTDVWSAEQVQYLTHIDFSFFYFLAFRKRLNATSALAIANVMHLHMIRQESQHRIIAERIFVKLTSKFRTEENTQLMLKQHIDGAVTQLALLDDMIKASQKSSDRNAAELSNNVQNREAKGIDVLSMQIQQHYLFKHLLDLARGHFLREKILKQNTLTQASDIKHTSQFGMLHDYICHSVEQKIDEQEAEEIKSQTLISLLKKLNQADFEATKPLNRMMSLSITDQAIDTESVMQNDRSPMYVESPSRSQLQISAGATPIGTFSGPFMEKNETQQIDQEGSHNAQIYAVMNQNGQNKTEQRPLDFNNDLTPIRSTNQQAALEALKNNSQTKIEQNGEQGQPKKLAKEMETQYDPPQEDGPQPFVGTQDEFSLAPKTQQSSDDSHREFTSAAPLGQQLQINVENILLQENQNDQGMQTDPILKNKKLQTSISNVDDSRSDIETARKASERQSLMTITPIPLAEETNEGNQKLKTTEEIEVQTSPRLIEKIIRQRSKTNSGRETDAEQFVEPQQSLIISKQAQKQTQSLPVSKQNSFVKTPAMTKTNSEVSQNRGVRNSITPITEVDGDVTGISTPSPEKLRPTTQLIEQNQVSPLTTKVFAAKTNDNFSHQEPSLHNVTKTTLKPFEFELKIEEATEKPSLVVSEYHSPPPKQESPQMLVSDSIKPQVEQPAQKIEASESTPHIGILQNNLQGMSQIKPSEVDMKSEISQQLQPKVVSQSVPQEIVKEKSIPKQQEEVHEEKEQEVKVEVVSVPIQRIQKPLEVPLQNAKTLLSGGSTLRTEIFSEDESPVKNEPKPVVKVVELQPEPQVSIKDLDKSRQTTIEKQSEVSNERNKLKQEPALERSTERRKALTTKNNYRSEVIHTAKQEETKKEQDKECKFCQSQNRTDFIGHSLDECPFLFKKLSLLDDLENNPQKLQALASQLNADKANSNQNQPNVQNIAKPYDTLPQSQYEPSAGTMTNMLNAATFSSIPKAQNPIYQPQTQQKPPSFVPHLQIVSPRSKPPLQPMGQIETINSKGVPISLPRVKDFWRGNPLGSTQYDDTQMQYKPAFLQANNLELLKDEFSSPPAISNKNYPMQRYPTMSQAEDDMMSEAFAKHNEALKKKRDQLLQIATRGHGLVRASTNVRDSSPEQLIYRGSPIDQTKQSWASGQGRRTMIRSKRERKAEISRLQGALERLRTNIGSDSSQAYPTGRQIPEGYDDQEDSLDQDRDDYQSKKEEDDNKNGVNNFGETLPKPEIQDQEELNRSKTEANGDKVGKTPRNDTSEEVIDIAQTLPDFDPEDPNLRNLTRNQADLLQRLISDKQNGKELRPSDEKRLEDLLDKLNNGVPLDQNHPQASINLAPSQRKQLADLLKQKDAGRKLNPKQQAHLDKLQDQLLNGNPLDSTHSGAHNLLPSKLRKLKSFENRLNDPKAKPLTKKERDLLDEIQEDLVNGTPLDSDHPGVKNLKPSEVKDLERLEEKESEGLPLSQPEQKLYDDLKEKLVYGTPLDQNNPGVQNLSPLQEDQLKRLTEKRAKDPKSLTPKEQESLEDLANLMENGTPVDESHKGAGKNLTPNQVQKLQDLLQKQQNGEPLKPKDKNELDKLKNLIVHGKPLNEKHPGSVNLTPSQLAKLPILLAKKKNGNMNPDDLQELQNLQNLLQNGQPLTIDHPGYNRLTPNKRKQFRNLANIKFNGGVLDPKDQDAFEKLANQIQQDDKPFDENHAGFANLNPQEKERLKNLLAKKRSGLPIDTDSEEEIKELENKIKPAIQFNQNHPGFDELSPEQQKRLLELEAKKNKGIPLAENESDELADLKDLMQNPVVIDENHEGFKNLLPNEQKKFRQLKDKGEDLTPQEEEMLEKLKDIIKNGRPIDENHPGWDNLNPREKAKFRKFAEMKLNGGPLNPGDSAQMKTLNDKILHGNPINENHPGFKNLNPYQKRRFKKLKGDENDGLNLSPMQRRELDDLKYAIAPHEFDRKLAEALEKLHRANDDGNLQDPDAQERLERLQDLKNRLPPSKDMLEFGVVDPKRWARLKKLLTKELKSPPPLTDGEKEELYDILESMPDPEANLAPDDARRLKQLARKSMKGQDLSPKEEEELEGLHFKQNQGRGNLTPFQQGILAKIRDFEAKGNPMTDQMNDQKNFMSVLEKMPSCLNEIQELEYQKMDENKKAGRAAGPIKDRLQDFIKMKHHPQLMTPLDQAFFSMMKELEQLPELNPDQEDILFILQKRFGCLPFITPKQQEYLESLQDKLTDKSPLSRQEKQDHERLEQLPVDEKSIPKEPEGSLLSPDERRELNRLLRKLQNGKPLKPEEEKRLKELQKKERGSRSRGNSPEEESKKNAVSGSGSVTRHGSPKISPKIVHAQAAAESESRLSPDSRFNQDRLKDSRRGSNDPENSSFIKQKSIIKTPDDKNALKKTALQRKVTYAPLPRLMDTESLQPRDHSIISGQSPSHMGHHKSQMPQGLNGSMSNMGSVLNLDERPLPVINSQAELLAARKYLTRAMKRGDATLKQLINHFYAIEEKYALVKYRLGIEFNYEYACALSNYTPGRESGIKRLPLTDFMKFAGEKKIKFKQHHIIEILRGDSNKDNISFMSFNKLLILASCGGDKTKIGMSNFKKLMKHMDIDSKE